MNKWALIFLDRIDFSPLAVKFCGFNSNPGSSNDCTFAAGASMRRANASQSPCKNLGNGSALAKNNEPRASDSNNVTVVLFILNSAGEYIELLARFHYKIF